MSKAAIKHLLGGGLFGQKEQLVQGKDRR
jgi:hypothetical protein